MFLNLKSHFPSRLVSAEVKMLALALTLINFVPAFLGSLWFSSFPLLFGIWIFVEQFQILRDNRDAEEVRLTSDKAIVYNSILLVIAGFMALDNWSRELIYLFAYLASVIGFNLLLQELLRESQSLINYHHGQSGK